MRVQSMPAVSTQIQKRSFEILNFTGKVTGKAVSFGLMDFAISEKKSLKSDYHHKSYIKQEINEVEKEYSIYNLYKLCCNLNYYLNLFTNMEYLYHVNT